MSKVKLYFYIFLNVRYVEPTTGLRVRFDAGDPTAHGYEKIDHYHILNPDAKNKRDAYLDINGNPVGKGTDASHIIPKEKRK